MGAESPLSHNQLTILGLDSRISVCGEQKCLNFPEFQNSRSHRTVEFRGNRKEVRESTVSERERTKIRIFLNILSSSHEIKRRLVNCANAPVNPKFRVNAGIFTRPRAK